MLRAGGIEVPEVPNPKMEVANTFLFNAGIERPTKGSQRIS